MHLKWKAPLIAALFVGGVMQAFPASAAQTACGTDKKIDIVEMSWPSAAALAHIHATILRDGYGCNVEIVAGETLPSVSSMITRGHPALAPELWTGAILELWNKGLSEGKTVKFGDAISDGTLEGWFIPKYVQEEHPDLVKVEDVVARPDLFPDPEATDKGRFYSCPPGWSCERANASLFKALGMDEKWNLFSPGSGGALDASVARAFIRKEPVLFYYWGPSAILGKYQTVQLDLGKVDPDVYACNVDVHCEKQPGKTAFPSSPALVGGATWIRDEAPVIADYLSKVGLTNSEISKLLVYGDENKADAAATAKNFLKTQPDVWKKWVQPDVSKKIETALN